MFRGSLDRELLVFCLLYSARIRASGINCTEVVCVMECIWYGFAAAFIFIGMVAAAYLVLLRVCGRGARSGYWIVLPVSAEQGDVGAHLYAAHLRRAALGDLCKGKILVIDQGLDENQKNLCLGIMRACGNMELCTAQEVIVHLEQPQDATR